jgi:hypothetical protein
MKKDELFTIKQGRLVEQPGLCTFLETRLNKIALN